MLVRPARTPRLAAPSFRSVPALVAASVALLVAATLLSVTTPAPARAVGQPVSQATRLAPAAPLAVAGHAARKGAWNPTSCRAPQRTHRIGKAYRQIRPRTAAHRLRKPRATIGIVTYNVNHSNSLRQARADATRLMRRPSVALIGFQEAQRFNGVIMDTGRRHGFQGVRFGVGARGARAEAAALMFAYRTSKFTFVRKTAYRMHGYGRGVAPFPSRWVVRVDLRSKQTGRVYSFFNTHRNQQSEAWCAGGPGEPTRTVNSTRAVTHGQKMARLPQRTYAAFAMGDMNVGYLADRRRKHRLMPWRQLQGSWRSTYDLLGINHHRTARGGWVGLPPTHKGTRRYIDYVYAGVPALKQRRVFVRRHTTVGPVGSDHRAVLAIVDLYR